MLRFALELKHSIDSLTSIHNQNQKTTLFIPCRDMFQLSNRNKTKNKKTMPKCSYAQMPLWRKYNNNLTNGVSPLLWYICVHLCMCVVRYKLSNNGPFNFVFQKLLFSFHHSWFIYDYTFERGERICFETNYLVEIMGGSTNYTNGSPKIEI